MTTPDPEPLPEQEQEQKPASLQESMAYWPTGRLLSTAARLVEHAWVEALAQLGLTHAGMIALHLLGPRPLSQTELAHAARVQTQTMSRTLERLEREGYVVRTRDEHDARRHSVVRTDAGTAVWERSRTLEADLFPELENPDALRDALLTIISASSARRW
jgi:DNA-binding MarR family transcriptional regulator